MRLKLPDVFPGARNSWGQSNVTNKLVLNATRPVDMFTDAALITMARDCTVARLKDEHSLNKMYNHSAMVGDTGMRQ